VNGSEPPPPELAALRELQVEEPRALVRERVRRRALAALASSSSRGPGQRLLVRFAMPSALAATVVVYLAWAFTAAGALYRR